jgi:hypothetical protein
MEVKKVSKGSRAKEPTLGILGCNKFDNWIRCPSTSSKWTGTELPGGGQRKLKVAATFLSESMVTMQGFVMRVPAQTPPQRTKVEFESLVAVRVTCVPAG